jgi:PD-(D/E)XK nuclease superfamily protein
MIEEADDIEQLIREFFNENFEALQLEAGHSLAPEVKETALNQVLLYWRRLKDVASKVTDTEVRLNLPEQVSPRGRKFGIEGIVDIVRENDRTVLYDIKTHDADSIRGNLETYEKQLNVYAFIWQNLRGQPLDETIVISTSYPEVIKEALASGDEARVDYELPRWNPLIEIPYNIDHVDGTIQDFGETVDAIEDGRFYAPPQDKLQSKLPGTKTIFAVNVCRNCDARFSCRSYRTYALGSSKAVERNFQAYFNDIGTDRERDDWVIASLDVTPASATLDELT